MRLSVECAFPYLRKRGAVSRKSAFCSGGLTEKRSLGGQPHGKAHSGRLGSRESAVCDAQIAQTALSRHIAAQEAWGATTRQAAGRFAPGSANLVLEFDFTKSRSLGAQLGRAAWARSLDEQSGRAVWARSLGRWSYEKAHPRSGRDTISSPIAIPVRVYEGHQEV